MTPPLEQSWKKSFTLVEFAYGTPTKYERFTDSNTDQSTVKGFYLAEPTLKATLPANTVGVKSKQLKVEIPVIPGNAFLESVSGGRIHAPVTVTVMELLKGDPPEADQVRTHFRSRMSATIRNPSGKEGLARFLSLHPKSRTKKNMGVVCNPQCSSPFGNPSICQFPLNTIQETGALSIVDDFTVTVSGLTVPAPNRLNYYRKGWIEFDGLRITIQGWDIGTPGEFKLMRRPPASWEGQTVEVTPGCLRTVFACREWGNEDNFFGLGIGMPIYNPLLEFTEVGR